ncbi:hypothetical protein SCLCIDRAFT_1043453 [Scleroderma citrinum Foug A]|uniref:Uncharacterized protein n=1 Tax=Scleroderma citrinum Foug A TaxID=1036808 RepID=A0A0C3A307_9AGAM|nr:hypothetical protein SCLCIDRAFT_1043453 [Scleroderma citrinum Foug A]
MTDAPQHSAAAICIFHPRSALPHPRPDSRNPPWFLRSLFVRVQSRWRTHLATRSVMGEFMRKDDNIRHRHHHINRRQVQYAGPLGPHPCRPRCGHCVNRTPVVLHILCGGD